MTEQDDDLPPEWGPLRLWANQDDRVRIGSFEALLVPFDDPSPADSARGRPGSNPCWRSRLGRLVFSIVARQTSRLPHMRAWQEDLAQNVLVILASILSRRAYDFPDLPRFRAFVATIVTRLVSEPRYRFPYEPTPKSALYLLVGDHTIPADVRSIISRWLDLLATAQLEYSLSLDPTLPFAGDAGPLDAVAEALGLESQEMKEIWCERVYPLWQRLLDRYRAEANARAPRRSRMEDIPSEMRLERRRGLADLVHDAGLILLEGRAWRRGQFLVAAARLLMIGYDPEEIWFLHILRTGRHGSGRRLDPKGTRHVSKQESEEARNALMRASLAEMRPRLLANGYPADISWSEVDQRLYNARHRSLLDLAKIVTQYPELRSRAEDLLEWFEDLRREAPEPPIDWDNLDEHGE